MDTKTKDFINKCKNKHGNKYDYTKTKYINANTKVLIICPLHGEFLQRAFDHQYGANCNKCADVFRIEKKSSNTKKFNESAIKLHGDKYDYSKVDYINCDAKVIIVCNEHGDFAQAPTSHLMGRGCPKCGLIKSSSDDFILKATAKHGDKYDYSAVKYTDCRIEIDIICKIHGMFSQTPNCHLSGCGCQKCAVIKSIETCKKRLSTKEEFIKKSIEKHGDKYDYDDVEYINTRTKVCIKCPNHGIFKQTPNAHLKGEGCYKCGMISSINISKQRSGTTEDFIKKAIHVHHKNKYDYAKTVYINIRTQVCITCPHHGNFKQLPYSHLQGYGCQKCNLCPTCQLFQTNGKLCSYCKPKEKNIHYQKTKEMEVVKYLKEQLPDNEFIHNKSVGADCTNGHLFPDIKFDRDYYNLIVEVDEHKHRGANYKCDERRMYDIIAKLGMPCIFIRYNPDGKKSDKNVLLTKIKEYLELDENTQVWDEFGFKADYLFY